MEAKILDGKQTSKEIVDSLKEKFEKNPTNKKLAIISVGDDYGSAVYCNMKRKKQNTSALVAKYSTLKKVFHKKKLKIK